MTNIEKTVSGIDRRLDSILAFHERRRDGFTAAQLKQLHNDPFGPFRIKILVTAENLEKAAEGMEWAFAPDGAQDGLCEELVKNAITTALAGFDVEFV